MTKAITFVSHEANRTGAPETAAHLHAMAAVEHGLPACHSVGSAGSAREGIRQARSRCRARWTVTPASIDPSGRTPGCPGKRAGREVVELGPLERTLANALLEVVHWPLREFGRCDLLYANSLESGLGVQTIHSTAPTISHIHEMADYLLASEQRANVQTMCFDSSRIIVPSPSVADVLSGTMHVSEQKISVVRPFIDVRDSDERSVHGANALRSEWSIPRDALVIGMCGLLNMRKGADLFVQIAAGVAKRATKRPVRFLWLGGRHDTDFFRYLSLDVARLGLQGQVIFVPEQSQPLPFLRLFDITLLSSRVDAFPLFCLEAGLVARSPVVCFDSAGGMPELVTQGCGLVVPYLDVEAAANAVVELVENDSLRVELGANAHDKVTQHFSVTTAGPQIVTAMAKLLP